MYFKIIPVLSKAEFSAAMSSVSHECSDILWICWFETFLININVANICSA